MFKTNRFVTLFRTAAVGLTIAAAAAASPVGGAKYDADVLGGFASVDYTVNLWGGEATVIRLSGDGDSDLDLLVFDENGNLIAEDLSYSDQAMAIVEPRWTGQFTVRVINAGARANAYTITLE
jgi:hypothetical protein